MAHYKKFRLSTLAAVVGIVLAVGRKIIRGSAIKI